MERNPKYVRVEHSALMLDGDVYLRLAGAWTVHFRRDKKGILRVHEPKNEMKSHLHGKRLVAITKEAHDKDNMGYL